MVDEVVSPRDVPAAEECPILILDESGQVVSSNEAARRLLGQSDGQLSAKRCHEVRAVPEVTMGGAARGSSPSSRSLLLGEVEGDQVVIQGNCVKLDPVVAGRELTVVVLSQLCTAVRPNGRLSDAALSDVAHAVRTPLCSMLGYLDLLADQYKKMRRAELGKIAQVLRYNARWMEHLVDNLLNELRLSTGRLSVAVAPVSLAGLMEDAAMLTEMLGAARNGRLTLLMPDKGAMALVDRNLVLQVLVNLLANATKRVAIGAHITVGASAREGFWQVTIADDATSAAWWMRPFASDEEMFSIPKSQQIYDDLSIILARAVIELHGGSIGINSTADKGNTFWLTLPAHEPRALPLAGAASAEAETVPVRVIATDADGLGKRAIDLG